MRKNLNLKTSWYTPENWEILINSGYLPVLAIHSPETHKGTAIHFPKIAPLREVSQKEYRIYLEENIESWKLIVSLDTLSHVACAPEGVVILTDLEDDPYRKVLGEFLGIEEYEYDRD